MKKLILIAAALVFGAGAASAQDMAQATETFNKGVEALQIGNNSGAVTAFKQALTIAQACGDEGADIVNDCKTYIPQLILATGQDLIKAGKYEESVAKLQEAAAAAKEYGNAEIEEKALDMIPQAYMQAANGLLKAGNVEGGIAQLQKVVAADTTNGKAFLMLGQVYSKINKKEEAVAALESAAKFGQESAANSQLANIYLKESQGLLKTSVKDALETALKSASYKETPSAYQIAGNAAYKLNQFADAANYFEKQVELAPTASSVPNTINTIATCYEKLGNKEKAIEFFTKIENDPQKGEYAKGRIAELKK
ncbi:MAG: tetratricopeptide repeat protein [Bacteroidales bacterium]|nr:tetratricopeptide repeat protein [Bacteroidales bacterium]